MKKTAVLVAALSCLSFVQLASADPLYRIIEIPLIDPGSPGQAPFGINDLGQVVGYEAVNIPGSQLRPFIWDTKGGTRELADGALGKGQIIPRDINNYGTTVGSNRVFMPSIFEYGFTVQGDGSIELFQPQDPYQILQPLGINDSGQFFGSLIRHAMPTEPRPQFLYTPGIGFEYIEPPVGYSYLNISDIADPTVLAGTMFAEVPGISLPIRWTPDQGVQSLPLPPNRFAWDMRVTNAGDAIGIYREMFVGQVDTLALWPAGGGRIDLAEVNIADYFFNIRDANSNLEMAGQLLIRNPLEARALVYRLDAGLFLLEDYVEPGSPTFDYLYDVRAVNEQGDMVGTAILGRSGFTFYAQKLS